MTIAGKRLTILSQTEIQDIYGLPIFNNDERAFYFNLDELERQHVDTLRSLESRIHFILQLGYFRCKSMFFNFTFVEVADNVQYIINKYFPELPCPHKMAGKATCFDNNAKVLKLLGFASFDKKIKDKLCNKAAQLVKICVDPCFILEELLNDLDQLQVAIPGYSTLQKIISKALNIENKRIQLIIRNRIPNAVNEDIKKLLAGDEQMYGITLLKKDAKGFNYKETIKEIDKKLSSQAVFNFAKQVIPQLRSC